MEIGKVIKLKNWNFIRWTRKHDMKFNSSLCSFYKIMKITRWLEYNRLIIKKKEKKIEKLKILALKHLIKSGKVSDIKDDCSRFAITFITLPYC